jgi:hypothetical protein
MYSPGTDAVLLAHTRVLYEVFDAFAVDGRREGEGSGEGEGGGDGDGDGDANSEVGLFLPRSRVLPLPAWLAMLTLMGLDRVRGVWCT